MTDQPTLSTSLQPPHGLTLPGPVWGLDPSTHRLAAAVCVPTPPTNPIHELGVHWATCSYSKSGSMEARLARALGDLLRFFTDFRNSYGGRPAAIYLEEPFGGSEKFNPKTKKKEIVKPHPHAFYFVGVVRCALGHVFSDVPVEMIGPPAWKKEALGTGHGFADKAEIMRWAREVCGYTGMLEDEADALGIMAAGAVKEAQNHQPRGDA
jgi:hypothetical protein